MGRRRRMREEAEAQALRKKRFRLIGVLFVAAAVLVGIRFLVPKGGSPASEEDRLIRIAAERGTFVFCSHGDRENFSLIEPFIEEAFQEARSLGRRVIFVEELGDVEPPAEESTGRPPSFSVRLERIEKDPVAAEATYRDSMARRRTTDRTLLSGRYFEPEYYEGLGGGYGKAQHACLIRNRALLAAVTEEDLTWQDYVENLRINVLQGRALDAYRRGDPDEYERIMREVLRRREARLAHRDQNLLLQVGKLLDGRDNLLVVSSRGIAHWGMVERFRLKGQRPDWAELTEDDYGMGKIDMGRMMGRPLDAEEERRALLSHAPGRFLEGRLVTTGRCKTLREASVLVKRILDSPSLTVERLRELCTDLGRSGQGAKDALMAGFVYEWLEGRGFLK